MNPRARPGRQSPPAFADAGEHGLCFGVIGDLARVGARQEQVRAGRRQHPLEEAVQDPERTGSGGIGARPVLTLWRLSGGRTPA